MRIPRVYFPNKIETNSLLELDERNHHYISNVLRLKDNMELILFNGDDGEYNARIKKIGKQTQVEILSLTKTQRESPLQIHLIQSITKGERMDYSIQKAVELGVSSITPVDTIRCVAKIKPDRLKKRSSHWQNIIISACEQTGRTRIPTLNEPTSLDQYLKSKSHHTGAYIFDTESTLSFTAALKKEASRSLNFLIGPEGGLEQEEFFAAQATGFQRVRLGPRILRTETVAPVVLAIAQSLIGDFDL